MAMITTQTVTHIALLANIPVTTDETETFAQGFTTTLGVIENLNSIDTAKVEPTHQVTGLENITREDVVDPERMFTQDQALANAKRTYNGYFVVDQLIGD